MTDKIVIRGARVHNLKNINVDIPRNKLVVITGLSGSGKSSLAFDTIYAEGQRRYVESLSAYARQFLGLMDKPDVDRIEGLSPAISIDQKSASHNPRSTVGTVTEIYDYLRLLFARVGVPHCPVCGKKIVGQTVTQMVDQIMNWPKDTKIVIMAPLVKDQKGEHKHLLEEAKKSGYQRVRFDGTVMDLAEALQLTVDKKKKHTIDVVVDRIVIDSNERARVADSLETALDLGNDSIVVQKGEKDPSRLGDKAQNRAEAGEVMLSSNFACPDGHTNLPELNPRNFSFNSPHGACPDCTGLGTRLEITPELVIPNLKLTLAEGAIRPWSKTTSRLSWYSRVLSALADAYGFSIHIPVRDLPKKYLDVVLYGTADRKIEIEDESGYKRTTSFEGVIPNLERKYKETDSDYMRGEIEQYMRIRKCPTCGGRRLKPEFLAVTIDSKSIVDVANFSIDEAIEWTESLPKKMSEKDMKIAHQIFKEIVARLKFLQDVGLNYLTLDRSADTLSGGEAQRIRLATQIGSGLTGVLYILDEPSIGLHQRDNDRLLKTLKNLRDLGNTVIVVEHDEETIWESDWVIDIGPGAGKHGGQLVAEGTPSQVAKDKNSLTGRYLSGEESVVVPQTRKKGSSKTLKVIGATEHNLKNIDVEIPLGKFVCLTGVSGSGKSTLLNEILAKALSAYFYNAKESAGDHKKILGIENVDKVINIDQSPIGRTPRSNPATYTGVFTYIRDLFAATQEARMRGYKAGRFSFNVKGGRCEVCGGDGVIKIEMHFLPDVYVTCEECKGKRYNKEALDIHYKGKTISDVLEMTVDEAYVFFRAVPLISRKLETLSLVGLGYMHLGQQATTLSGGEAQRIKLATELSRASTGRTLYILDEPTTGLHFDDVKRLLGVLNRLVEKGNTVLVIEHNLDVIKSADWIIDLGPEGGHKGGFVVAVGTPEEVAKVKKSYTGQYLARVLKEKVKVK
ncbi:MAG: excinuclease ABC subunit A [Candidatus Doudnabacteria bacterium RIFCSPLOWO2_02_FULL_49_13]|uniref:UvrABC system protein A n=1 Tax=Candidatus Doudnabacteria bacterium RIFCSPHIGHO2_12_FULL_48_16 TaxID=1817838 RepID=A0A1F5PJX4_9BACT|nr:MAG: excinuclease ABC subunit A [Candidatus Doudnabacteria bacterium RIFCSPHIGHO2_02_FULL_49_24]OGE89852.1 MAG: excinuclease ABC subunit A [Candidatus Doudnabacteria bacterium RIFCSPHIGHO2_01_FULL_50_67]OGE90226.1 MAG: excinuclease ABC subunit A [Candidatus Doudnabacteria bacterium RIFCSPHIGHO2_12_FULL_48_16]OGE96776.1 MAG: excinuclease ABC subunit A [Candidatus Doudnabacteria bacterium RIFCSPLOWO2_01_FULL_49_40]OGF03368.1 MAG: excinuclease ABC subunit A [Candidatus Doudnabacteria bacterium 